MLLLYIIFYVAMIYKVQVYVSAQPCISTVMMFQMNLYLIIAIKLYVSLKHISDVFGKISALSAVCNS